MIKKWSEYSHINENLQKARSILRRLSISEDNLEFKKLRELLKNNTGYIGKFTHWMFNDKHSYSDLETLFNNIKSSKLSKPIDEFETPDEVLGTINNNKELSVINQFIGAIPSNTREFLRKGSCDDCDNEREIYCETCGGDGDIDCKVCDGNGEVDCEVCGGESRIHCKICKRSGTIDCKACKGKKNKDECEVCDGDEEVECVDCDGYGSIPCNTCGENGTIECSKCKGESTEKCNDCTVENNHMVKCKSCEKDTNYWLKFIEFLKKRIDNKDLIIDFLSKKSARYDADDFDYQDDDAIDALMSDIDMLINLPSLSNIIENSINDDSIKHIYEDDNKLIVAVNYKGVKKYGSSYWCIVDDEDTFDGYVTENCQQWIVYFKNKKPLLDEESMMGITYNVKEKEVEAAHWEDDSECLYDARKIISQIKLDISKVIKAFSIYTNSIDMLFEYPEYFKSEIEGLVVSCKEYSDKKDEFEKSLIGKKGRKPRLPVEILRNSELLFSKISDFINNNENWYKESTDIISNKCKELNFKIPVTKRDADVVFYTGLWRSCVFDKFDFNIFDFIDDMNSENMDDFFKWLKENNYDFGDCVNSENAFSLYKIDVIDLDTLIDNFESWRDIDHNKAENIELACKIVEKVNAKNYDNYMFLFIIKALSTDSKLVEKYKELIIDIIKLDNVAKYIIESILDLIDDDDIEMICARKLMHKKIASKYDIDMRRKVLERLMTFEKFKKS